jgi:hypothetical protein
MLQIHRRKITFYSALRAIKQGKVLCKVVVYTNDIRFCFSDSLSQCGSKFNGCIINKCSTFALLCYVFLGFCFMYVRR